MKQRSWDDYFGAVKRQDWTGTVAVLLEIARSQGDNPQVFLKLGDCYRRLNDTSKAVESYHRSAALLLRQGFRQKAAALFKIILRVRPDDTEAISQTEQILTELESSKDAGFQTAVKEQMTESPSVISGPESSPAPGQDIPDKSGVPESRADRGTDTVNGGGGRQSEKPSRLRKPAIFSSMCDDDFTEYLGSLQIRAYSEGETVIEEGDAGDSLFIVAAGSAAVIAHLLGKRVQLAELGPGDLFGEVSFLTGRPRTATVVSGVYLAVYELTRPQLEELITGNPEILATLEEFHTTRAQDTLRKIRPGGSASR